MGTALCKVKTNHVWTPFLDLKNLIPEVGYPSHTHVIFGVCFDSETHHTRALRTLGSKHLSDGTP